MIHFPPIYIHAQRIAAHQTKIINLDLPDTVGQPLVSKLSTCFAVLSLEQSQTVYFACSKNRSFIQKLVHIIFDGEGEFRRTHRFTDNEVLSLMTESRD